jgi:hypothetical protein
MFSLSVPVAGFKPSVVRLKDKCSTAVLPGANVIKLFTAVIYCHSMVIPSFCVIKLYYLGNYHGMAVNYHSN